MQLGQAQTPQRWTGNHAGAVCARGASWRGLSSCSSAIDETVVHHHDNPGPFIWTKRARDIVQKVIRVYSRFSSKQNGTLH